MNKIEVMQKLKEIFEDVFAQENIEITEQTDANDIEGWDSLAHITILEAIQAEYEINFDIDEIIEMNNVGDIIEAIIKKNGRKCG